MGKDFDALRITPSVANSPFNLFSMDTTEDIIQKFFVLGAQIIYVAEQV